MCHRCSKSQGSPGNVLVGVDASSKISTAVEFGGEGDKFYRGMEDFLRKGPVSDEEGNSGE